MKRNKVAIVLINIGVLIMVIGLLLHIGELRQENRQQQELLDVVSTQLIQCNEEESGLYGAYLELEEKNMVLEAENKSLWDNYYMNVTNQEGYEYYE